MTRQCAVAIATAAVAVLGGALPIDARAAGTVGTGSAASCTEASFDAALVGGGAVTFDCGGPATITFTATKAIAVATSITGAPGIVLSGGNAVRLFNVTGGGLVVDITKAIGAVPLLKPASETFEIMKSGIADGILFPKDSVPAFKLVPLVNHMTVVPGGLYNVSFFLVMNEAKFKGLSKADQDAIMKVSGEHYARMAGKVWDREDAAGLKAMEAEKIIIRTASPEFVAEIKSKTDPLEKAWYNEAKAKGVDGAAVMAEFRAEIQKLSKK